MIANLRFEHEARNRHKLDEIPIFVKVGGFLVLFLLLLVKNFHMERGIMKRFIEDYDSDVHENFPFFSRPAGEQGDQVRLTGGVD